MIHNVSGIYQIKNIVNNKIYIGSAEFIKERWVNHKSLLKRNVHHSIHFQNSWNKYGEKNFKISILEECSKSELIFKEQFYLNKLLKADQFILKNNNYFIKHGLNIKPIANPGFFGKHSLETITKILKKKARSVLAIDPNGNILGNYISTGIASKFHVIRTSVIRNCIKNKTLNKQNKIGFIYEDLYQPNYIPKKFIPYNKGKKVLIEKGMKIYMFNIYGEFINTFKSQSECARFLKVYPSRIHKKLNKIKSKNVYSNVNDSLYLIFNDRYPDAIKNLNIKYKNFIKNLKTKGKLKIERLDKICIGYFNSQVELAKLLFSSPHSITSVLNGKRKQLKGYYITYNI